ncbi:NAD(+) synthase [Candidatus Viadribacter manganicus]|uniref:Glutamine-dependent NAD(+) synthetase n=1 Tax=Candidatus Viadribacter manganicus TaxID=1759059 RepID=A0A1B1AFZ5_9PROT|nr:NAD(+) synthase [Candidatus Viadribacter manganicus]ANP45482.1 NAD synthetase [Candidatus Viadribacter manganicus]
MASRKAQNEAARRFKSLYSHGFVRVAACAPVVAPANPAANAEAILSFWREADGERAAILVTPELSLSGYAIDDLLLQEPLLDAVESAISTLLIESEELFPILIVGAPIRSRGAVFNCAIVIHRGQILGVVPKSFLPNYREFYEKRYFSVASDTQEDLIQLCGEWVGFGEDVVFTATDNRDFAFHVEICEDFWAPTPPSTMGALAGANILLNLSASNIVIGKAEDRAVLCDSQSRRAIAAYVFAASGRGESTTDLAWDGQIIAYEMGEKVAEAERFAREPKLVIADIDVARIAQERRRVGTFRDAAARAQGELSKWGHITFELGAPEEELPLKRKIDRFPFVPDDLSKRDRDCFEAYNIQVSGLAKRIESTNTKRVVIGVSGGLDSTHALIVIARAFDLLGLPRKNIIGVTMPGFATSDATKANAWALMNALGIDGREVSIEPLAQRMLEDLDHPAARGEKVYDVAYENVQAGLRTDYLFRLANKEGGFVVGTGDLSELALGWCTYGVGDHMSHYNVNGGAPKTLIQYLIRWVSDSKLFDAKTSETLIKVLEGEISPELIPGAEPQSTQAVVGPYELQDFNLFYLTRYGLKPSKILFLAWSAWREKHDYATLKKWLGVFISRFFTNQYKRSAVPNGPKIVSGGALSPRGDWRMPSDASAAVWLAELSDNTPEALD